MAILTVMVTAVVKKILDGNGFIIHLHNMMKQWPYDVMSNEILVPNWR